MRLRHALLPALASIAVVAALASPAAAASHGLNRDSDHDGMPDRWEVAHQLNPRKAADARQDADHDGVTNRQEFVLGGDPRADDTDGDGLDDGDEVRFHTRLNRADSDGDGVSDGDEDANHDGICNRDQREAAGVIADFDDTTGELTLTTRSGATRTVTLTDDTQIEQREHKGWRHIPGGPASDGHHHGDDANDPGSSGPDDSSSSGDDWSQSDAGDDADQVATDDSADDSDDSDDSDGSADVVAPENVDLVVAGVVVLKVELASDGTVAQLRLA